MVTNADGTQTAKTLMADTDDLTITEINLNADATDIVLPDGSRITGQASFTRSDGSKGTVADVILVAEQQGYRVERTVTPGAGGVVTQTIKAYDASGNLAFSITSVTSANGLSISNSYDDNGDQVIDRIQTINTTINSTTNARTETLSNYTGNTIASAILDNRTVTTTSADGKSVTIQRDATGGGWFSQTESRVQAGDNTRTHIITNYAKDGTTILSRSTETMDVTGKTRTDLIDADGNTTTDTRSESSITTATATGIQTTLNALFNRDNSPRSQEKEVLAANGRDKVISRDIDGNGAGYRMAA